MGKSYGSESSLTPPNSNEALLLFIVCEAHIIEVYLPLLSTLACDALLR